MEQTDDKESSLTKEKNKEIKNLNKNVDSQISSDLPKKSPQKTQQNAPKQQTLLNLSNLFSLYQPYRENQNSISPEEISILPRMPYLKGVDKDLGGNLYSCFKTASNCPVTWEVAKQQGQNLPSALAKEIEKEYSPYPKENEQSQGDSAFSQGNTPGGNKKKGGKHNIQQNRTSGRHSRQKTESPPKVVHFADYRKPSYRPYVPYCDIINPSKGRRPPSPPSSMPADVAQDVIIETFKVIKETKKYFFRSVWGGYKFINIMSITIN